MSNVYAFAADPWILPSTALTRMYPSSSSNISLKSPLESGNRSVRISKVSSFLSPRTLSSVLASVLVFTLVSGCREVVGRLAGSARISLRDDAGGTALDCDRARDVGTRNHLWGRTRVDFHVNT